MKRTGTYTRSRKLIALTAECAARSTVIPMTTGDGIAQMILVVFSILFVCVANAAEPRCVSDIYPHLAMFNNEGECGTGAVVPWADRLWVITYGPHKPTGSSDKLYEVTPNFQQIIRSESIGGTPANRMIHRESNQLFIGPYAIDSQRNVRIIPYAQMFGRLTATARHLTNPADQIYYATMEEGFYEVDVKTLAVTRLYSDQQVKGGVHAELPGYHGKGLYSGQGRLIYANNGEHANDYMKFDAPSGCLAEWDGKTWHVIRRNQFCDVTGPGGINGNAHPDTDPIWAIGWDYRSLILMLLDGGQWYAYRLPKASHCYDGTHGWHTEWPRIRDIGEDDLLMTMHGTFWRFPKTFSAKYSAGIAPRSTYLKIIGDFCRWNDRIVIGCDDAAIIEVPRKLKGKLAPTGQSQSNLQFLKPPQLDEFGPALGRGAVWLNDAVKAGTASDPFLFSGYTYRSLFLTQNDAQPVTFTLEVDARGTGDWKQLRDIEVPAHGTAWTEFTATETGAWVRLKAGHDCAKATAYFQYRNADSRRPEAADMFVGLARPGDANASGGLLHQRGDNAWTLQCIAADGKSACYELDGDLKLRLTNDHVSVAWVKTNLAIPRDFLTADNASVICVENNHRWRLPKGDASFEWPGAGANERVCREAVTERDLFNAFGTFYELPAETAGGFSKIRPITTHNRHIKDYASYRGMLVMSGVGTGATGEHIIRSDDGKAAVWVGALDDLWQFGKPRGIGGPWKNSAVKAGVASDPYLMTGYDKKSLTLSSDKLGKICVEVDITGEGFWCAWQTLEVVPGKPTEYQFPDAFNAYWVRVVTEKDCVATATFVYE